MSQALSHSFGEFCPISPKPIYSLCIAAHSRFAKAENLALSKVHGEAMTILGDNASLCSFATSSLPPAYIGDRPLIECLLDSLLQNWIYLQFAPQLHAANCPEGEARLGPRLGFIIYMQGQRLLTIYSTKLDRRS